MRRGRHKFHRLTQVILPALAVATPPTRHTGFECDTVARSDVGDRIADFDDLPGALVAENDGALDDVLADTAVFVVVGVGSTDTDIADSHENVVWPGLWPGTVAELEPPRFDSHSGLHTAITRIEQQKNGSKRRHGSSVDAREFSGSRLAGGSPLRNAAVLVVPDRIVPVDLRSCTLAHPLFVDIDPQPWAGRPLDVSVVERERLRVFEQR